MSYQKDHYCHDWKALNIVLRADRVFNSFAVRMEAYRKYLILCEIYACIETEYISVLVLRYGVV